MTPADQLPPEEPTRGTPAHPLEYARPLPPTTRPAPAWDRYWPAMCLMCGVNVCIPFATGALGLVYGYASLRHWGELSVAERWTVGVGLLASALNLAAWLLLIAANA